MTLQVSSSFPINEECTSISVTSSGQLIVAGFTDGTIRLFDRTGRFVASSTTSSTFHRHNTDTSPESSEGENEFEATTIDGDDDLTSLDEGTENGQTLRKKGKVSRSSTFLEVSSSHHQRYGAVACQIVAKGVHTALKLDCVISEDDQYCFASVLRGNMECVAIHIGPLVETLSKAKPVEDESSSNKKKNLLDYVHVYRHSDAKLRGLGACTRLLSTEDRPQYLLLTGKSIKNIHIWRYQPPIVPFSSCTEQEPLWQCLYDCATNGNTIQWLAFRRDDDQKLYALSKSMHQKLRVWDISSEEVRKDNKNTVTIAEGQDTRPTRPPYTDILNTESALGVAGNWIVCGGELFNHQISIVSLDNTNNATSSIYNHTELALPLPVTTGVVSSTTSSSAAIDRRQQRGDMRCVTGISGIQNHVVLELSDGNVAEYHVGDDIDDSARSTNTNATTSGISMMNFIQKLTDNSSTRQLSVRQLQNPPFNVVVLIATFHSLRRYGTITIQPLVNHYINDRLGTSKESRNQTIVRKGDVSKAMPSTIKPRIEEVNQVSADHDVCFDLNNTTKKMKKKKHHLPSSISDSKRSQTPPFVSTIKKKKMKMSTCINEKVPFQTPINTNKEIKRANPVNKGAPEITSSIKTVPQPHIAAAATSSSNITRKEISFVTPHPKKIIHPLTLSTTQSKSSVDSKETPTTTTTASTSTRSDNYLLSTIYNNSIPSSIYKNVSITPLNDQDRALDYTSTSATVDHQLSPVIPRKRPSMSSTEDDRNLGNVNYEANRIPVFPATPMDSQHEVEQDRGTIVGSSPESSVAFSSSSISVSVDVSTNSLSKPKTAPTNVSVSSKSKTPVRATQSTIKSILPSKVSTPNSITTTRERIIDSCYDKLQELESFENNVDGTLGECMMMLGTTSNSKRIMNLYDKKYSTMISHHYASHVQIRKRIIDATRATIYSILDAPIVSSLDKAKGFLHSALMSYEELMNSMMQLQRMEAYSLYSLYQQQQESLVESDFEPDREVAIPFSFPTIFCDVMTFLPDIN